MNKLITLTIAATLNSCVNYEDVGKRYAASIASITVGTTYEDMVIRIGHKPYDYNCDFNICTALYLVNIITRDFKGFVFNNGRVTKIIK